MAAAHHEPISYLDSILNEEENRCEYSHTWRNFTISRSGRFKSKNKKRDTVDTKLFDAAPTNHITTNSSHNNNNNNYNNNHNNNSNNHKLDCNNSHRGVSGASTIYNTLDKYNTYGNGGAYGHSTSSYASLSTSTVAKANNNKIYHPQQMQQQQQHQHQQQQQTAYAQRDSYKKYYETNL